MLTTAERVSAYFLIDRLWRDGASCDSISFAGVAIDVDWRAQLRAELDLGGGLERLTEPERVSIEMGRQKYVLIRLLTEPVMHLVRGVCGAEYHKDAAAGTAAALTDAGIGFTILGGGRIEASPSSISIFGFSYGFPWDGGPRHDLTAELCRGAYPDAKIEVSDSGY